MTDILIVESDETVRSILAETLARAGFEAVSTPFAKGCRQFVADNGPPNVFVIDAVLPRGDGVALGRELAAAYRGTVGVLLVNCGRLTGSERTDLPGLEVYRSVDPDRIVDRVAGYT